MDRPRDKRTPHYRLEEIQRLARHAHIRQITVTAKIGLRELGLTESEAWEVIQVMKRKDFHKSMLGHEVPRLWQDLYCPWYRGVHLYIKVSIHLDEVRVISFKRR